MVELRRKFFGLFLLQLVVGVSPAQEKTILTLEEARQRYLSRNPQVEAERQRIEMARGELRQAGLPPNPQVNYSQEGFPLGSQNTSYDDQEFILWATQKLELGGKRGHRTNVAQFHLEATEAAFQEVTRSRVNQLKEIFLQAYFGQKKRDLTRQHLTSYNELRTTHQKRYHAGDVSGLSQLRVDLEEIRFLSAVSAAETDFASGWARLAALIAWSDADLPRLEMAPGEFPDRSREELKEMAYRSRPDLEVLASQRAEMRETIELEESQRIPDLTLGGGYKRDFGINSFYAAFQLPIPLFNRNQGSIGRARAQQRRVENEYLWKRIQIGAEVDRAYQVYRTQQSHVERIQDDLLGRAETALEVTRQSYQEGEASLMDYLDALRVRLDTSLSYYELLFQLQRARLQLEQATATDLP